MKSLTLVTNLKQTAFHLKVNILKYLCLYTHEKKSSRILPCFYFKSYSFFYIFIWLYEEGSEYTPLHEILSDLDLLQVAWHIQSGFRNNGFHGDAHIRLEADWLQHSVQDFAHIISQVETNAEINQVLTNVTKTKQKMCTHKKTPCETL